MSSVEASFCRIPLLDGDKDSTNHIISLESVSHDLDRLRELYVHDEEMFATYLYTAWSLLLRCFTGQDNVSFRTSLVPDTGEHSASTRKSLQRSTIRVDFHEDASLEACLKATDRSRKMEYSSGSSTKQTPDTSRQPNTQVIINGTTSASDPNASSSVPEIGDIFLISKVNTDMKLTILANSIDASFGYVESLANTLAKISKLLFSPHVLIRDLDYMGDGSIRNIQAWTEAPARPVNNCIHNIVHEQSLLRPDQDAICAWDRTMTYRELWAHVQQLAQILNDLGVGPEEVIVPLVFEKSVWTIVAMLAVMEVGAGFSLLDGAQPTSRLKALSVRLGADVILCSRLYAKNLSSVSANVLAVDKETFRSREIFSRKMDLASPSNIAYVVWTSGSTGQPKAIVIEHRAYCSAAKAHAAALCMYPESRVLQFASYVFDASILESLTPLMLGATTCIPDEQARLNDLPMAINQFHVDWALLTPSIVNFLDPSTVPRLRTLVLGGEVMSQENLTTWSHIKLINAYGPAECSVVTAANSDLTSNRGTTLIGYGVGATPWLVDPEDYNKLVPPGCVAELVLEGPSVARGYHGDPERTALSFIEDPLWAMSEPQPGNKRRMYRTGDLVRYHTGNGMMYFLGRKDTQIKLHGQRIELGETEHHLARDASLRQSMVAMPKHGPLKGRLVALVCPQEESADGSQTKERHLRIVGSKAQQRIVTTSARERLAAQLPAFMVPSVWLAVDSIPLMGSGKLDRKTTVNWLHEINGDELGDGETIDEPASEIESHLRSICSLVLNLKPETISITRSFLNLGGDSISAMLVRSRCKKVGIRLTVQDILRAKSLRHLAGLSRSTERDVVPPVKIEEDFDLSPIQSLYFERPDFDEGHFNQSFFVRLSRMFEPRVIQNAIKRIVNRHSMLRARFSLSTAEEEWKQRITLDVTGSYKFREHSINSREDAVPIISQSQASLDPIKGPLLAVNLFNQGSSNQLLFLVAHHLVMDLVSWRVILQELEDILTDPKAVSDTEPSVSFQGWAKLQIEHAHATSLSAVLPTVDIPKQDSTYWGMDDRPNLYGDAEHQGFELDTKTTALILGKSQQSLRTDTVDMLVAALSYSYSEVFTDQGAPTIFNEGHGREVWDDSIDLSRTVGWFTTIHPIHVPTTTSIDFIDVLRRVKDYRRCLLANGRPYFASRMLTAKGAKKFRRHWPHIITFNYLGIFSQLEREDALLIPIQEMAGEVRGAGGVSDVGFATPRFGLFEISAVVAQGKLRFAFTFNRHMKHQQAIKRWIESCQQFLTTRPQTLAQMAYQPTLSDYPLMNMSYESLEYLIKERLPSVGISDLGNVEDIYSCSQIQQGLLISTQRDAGFYAVAALYQVRSNENSRVDGNRIASAWQRVVDRHASLRTVFIDSSSAESALYDQVVLRRFEANVVRLSCESEAEVAHVVKSQPTLDYSKHAPAHRFTICETAQGQIFCNIEIWHVIMDGASLSILLQDLSALYNNKAALLSEAAPSYSNYIAFSRSLSQQAGIGYWTSYLAELEPVTFPVLNDGTVSERMLKTRRLDFSRLDEIQSFCNVYGVTMANVFLTAWAMTLQIYTGRDDVCFGYLMSTRDTAIEDIENVVGYLVNMLVCRVSLAPEVSVASIMQQVQSDLSNCQTHRHTALAEVLHALDLGGTSLFNTTLSYRKLPPATGRNLQEISLDEWTPYHDPTEYSVSINIEVSDDNAAIDLAYYTDCLSDGHATNVLNTFAQALQNLIEHPESDFGLLDPLSKSDRRQIMEWNRNIPPTIERCIHDVIAEQMALYPTAEAVRGHDATFTYEQLGIMSGRLASYLHLYDVGPESYVCLCIEKSAFAIMAMLGVLRAGGAFVSLDPSSPIDALKMRIEDTKTRVVLTSSTYDTMFVDMGLQVVPLNQIFLDSLDNMHSNPTVMVEPHNPCCVIFTSGSTGRPKAVQIEHKNLVTSIDATATRVGFDRQTRALQFASFTFDVSLEQIFCCLTRGGTVCMPSDHDRLYDFAGAVKRLEANFTALTPTVATYLDPATMPSIRKLTLGGEVLSRAALEVWADKVDLHCQYGPAECTIYATHRTGFHPDSEPTNLGRSLASVSWIVDPLNHDRLLPIGREGELLIEGPTVTRGYLNDPDKTAAVFIENPSWTQDSPQTPGQLRKPRRMYKTGDIVRYNSDGSFCYLGRKDQQIKLHGQRIELGEIEFHVRANLEEEWQSAVDLVIPSHGGESAKTLAVFVRPLLDANLAANVPADGLLSVSPMLLSTLHGLESALIKALPKHMVPSLYVPCARLPLSSSGKLDRKQLRAIANNMTDAQTSMYRLSGKNGAEPTTEVETTLAASWADILSIDQSIIGMDSQFFRMGGDSIAAIRLVTAARSKGIRLTVANVFREATLSEMCRTATLISDLPGKDVPSGPEPFELLPSGLPTEKTIEEVSMLCKIQPGQVEDIYPSTSMQEGLMALSGKQPGAYMAQSIYSLASLDIGDFKAGWEAVVSAEPILRTRLVYTDTFGFLQVVVNEGLEWVESSCVAEVLEKEGIKPGYNGDKLSSYSIVHEGREASFVWTIHHALYDGWSMNLVMNKVKDHYQRSTSSESTPLRSYASFIQYIKGIDTAASEDYWRSRLAETSSPQYPMLPRPTYQPQVTSVLSHDIPVNRPSGSDITFPSLIRSAWALTISAYSGSDDVVFGETVTGRDAPLNGIMDLTGPTLATVPVRVQVQRQMGIGSFLKHIYNDYTDALPHQQLGLQHIKRINADTAATCDFQNLIAINTEADNTSSDFWRLVERTEKGFLTYALTVTFTVSSSGVKLAAHYDPDIISEWQLQRLLHYLDCVLQRLVAKERTAATLADILGISEIDENLISQWNSEQPLSVKQCIHDRVSDRAASLPATTQAIYAWDAQFTYQELESLSNSFAYKLQKLGVTPRSYVPICLEKSAVAPVVMLAILKVGAAWAPIDNAWPEARSKGIVHDVEAKLVLCSPQYAQVCESLGVEPHVIDLDMLLNNRQAPGELPHCSSSDVAYLIFTSGSTGKPKGTMVPHAAYASGAVAHARAMQLGSSSRVLQFSSYTFDASVIEIFTTLMEGGCVCIPDDQTRLNNVSKAINGMHVDLALLTPSFAHTISPADVPGLKTLVLVGEAVSQHHVSTWVDHVRLGNGYGPSETAALAVVNGNVTRTSDPSNIGQPVGSHCFVVDQNNHEELVPVGAIGELLIVGNTVGCGYLKDQQKTEQVFVGSPQFLRQSKALPHVAGLPVYKTGDLVKYDSKGSFVYVGRKDNQTKVNGQRLELGEVEHHLGQVPGLQYGLATIPKKGPYAKKLVGALVFKLQTEVYVSHNGLDAVAQEHAKAQVCSARDCLTARLPPYMVPSSWILLKEIPLLTSGKLDRRQITTWIEEMPDEIFRMVSGIDCDDTELHGSNLEEQLLSIWVKVLHLSPEQIGLDKNFLYVGGDSISALQVASQCRSQGLGVTIRDIIRCPSISDLAKHVTLPQLNTQFSEEVESPFELAPIQRLFFRWVGASYQHFNQSIALRMKQRMDVDRVRQAIDSLAKSHSMLRARFSKNESGQWMQTLARDASNSLIFRSHTGRTSLEQIKSVIEAGQSSLDIHDGPICAVNLFDSDESGSQVLSLIVHHLCVDVVSWGIILDDLERCLVSYQVTNQPSLSFQVWSRLQKQKAQSEPQQTLDLGADIPAADFEYWNMTQASNPSGAAVKTRFQIDQQTTANLSGPCNRSLDTELPDVILGAILHAFCRSFPDRQQPPAVFNEAHGREPWDASIDLSQTVGWFTTISPVFLPAEAAKDDDMVNIVRWIKDQRRRTKDNGRPYFAHRMLTDDRQHTSSAMEIAFNYLGQEKQFKKDTALFEPLDSLIGHADVGASVPRLALFEISASIAHDCLEVSFQYPQAIRRREAVLSWASQIKTSLLQASQSLLSLGPQTSLSQFTLVPMAYSAMKKIESRLPSIGVSSITELEDIYGCTPMQQGIVLSQIKTPTQYMFNTIITVKPTDGSRLDSKRFAQAWGAVVQKHSALRTVFFESISKDGLTDQAVLKKHKPKVHMLHTDTRDAVEDLRERPCISFSDPQPHHQLTICETNDGRILAKLELSHTLIDGSSIPLLFQDLVQAYITQPAPLERALTYCDYVAYLQRTTHEDNTAYWRRYLRDLEPSHFPALTDDTKCGRQLGQQRLELQCFLRLQTFCSERGVTLSTALQFVWSLVLRAYTGNQNVCFGYLTSGRDVPVEGIERAVGIFISMLVCRIDCNDDMKIHAGLEKIRDDYTQSMAHQGFSLGNMQHEMQLSGASLFNTAFTYQRRPSTAHAKKQALTVELLDAYDPSEYDITVNVEVHDATAAVYFNYWTDFLCDIQAINLMDTFNQVLDSMITTDSPDRTVRMLNFCGANSKEQIVKWNNIPLPRVSSCIHDVIIQQSHRLHISTPAVCSWDGNLSYNKLLFLSTRLAHQLSSLGVGPESYVPICFEKSSWAIVAMLGVLQAGGAFVPLEPSHPEERLDFIIRDVGAQLILTSSKYRKRFAEYPGVLTHVVDKGLERKTQGLLEDRVSPVTPSNAAYLIFTSGTTGLPKGTIISHQAFTTGATEHAPRILMRPTSRVLQFSNLCFDASIMEILSTLITGACVCIPKDEERMNDISGAIRRMSVNWTLLTPSVAEVLDPENVPTLKTLVTGGEAMQARHIAKWKGKTSLVNAYGPSEASVIATASVKVDEQKNLVDEDPTVIGCAVGARSWIVNPQDHNQLMPIGSVGELIIEGNTVASGYLNNEEKTAKAFVARPPFLDLVASHFASDPGQLIYKTGDLVRYKSNGDIAYVARKDTQIKLNGLRIELGDIEHHVKQKLPETVQSAVELVAPPGKRRTLAAFFSSPNHLEIKSPTPKHPSTGESGDLQEDTLISSISEADTELCRSLKADLAGSLPAYMIPTLFVPITRMPWTASGKLDRVRLCKEFARLTAEEIAPFKLAVASNKRTATTEMERRLQALWEQVLNLKPGATNPLDSFFVLGGDSVQAMSLVAQAREQKISLSVLDIFRKPVLSDMASACRLVEEEDQVALRPFGLLANVGKVDAVLDEAAARCDVKREQVVDAYPCSALQEALITLSIKQPGAYVASNVFRLSKSVNIDEFKKAWQRSVNDMEILRTRVVHTSMSTFVQVVLKEDEIEWQELSSVEDAGGTTIQLAEDKAPPLLRFALVRGHSQADRYFVWSIHHALYDGWSMPRMLQRVEDYYMGRSPHLSTAPYSGFIKYLSSQDGRAADRFWRSKFNDLQSIHFPKASSLGSEQEGSTDTMNHMVRLPQQAAKTGITLPTVIRAAWALLLSAHTGSDDVVFGETMTGRDVPVDGVTEMLGPTLTTVPTRIQLDRSSPIMQLLRKVHQDAAEVIPYQHVGLQRIRRLNDDTSMACDFQNLLVIQTAQGDGENSKLWDPVNTGVGSSFFTYPLVVECNTEGDTTAIEAHYNRHAISKWQVQRLLYQLEQILGQICLTSLDSQVKLSEVQVISQDDMDLIRQWNDYDTATVTECIHGLFLQQAEETPDALAVDAHDGSFTYRELSLQAEKLSNYLEHNCGVSPEALVPFCMDKSRWAIVAMIGVMMAGGAIVPLDPGHPVGRHAEIIKDSQANTLLCSPAYRSRYAPHVKTVIPIDEKSIAGMKDTDGSGMTLLEADSKNTAYVIYTSGSTGKPKGVVVEHEAFCSSSSAYCKATRMLATSRVFNFASVTFDVGLMECLSPLTMGACVCVPSEEAKMTDLAAAIDSLRATWAFLTPSVANLIEPSAVPTLKTLVVGGEAMSKENVAKWADALDLINGFGPTEAAVLSIVNPNTSQQKDSSIIGYAHDNGYAWIAEVDDHNRLAPLGCVGELLLGGPILAREYLHDEVKTKAAFIDDPTWARYLSKDPSVPTRVYKTGDLVKYAADGSIIFIGRANNQVKLNGNRIELGEIEHTLEMHPSIRHAVTVIGTAGLAKGKLVAVVSLSEMCSQSQASAAKECVLLEGDARVATAKKQLQEVRTYVSDRLPAYMIPALFVTVEAIPLLVSGKLDRKEVEKWLDRFHDDQYRRSTAIDSDEGGQGPITETVRKLREVWSTVFNIPVEEVNPGRSFMSQGGDSLISMTIISQLRKVGIVVSLQEILQSKSLFQLASLVDSRGNGLNNTKVALLEEKVDEAFDLSPVQRLYFEIAGPSSDHTRDCRFNQSQLLQLRRSTNGAILRKAICTIVQQHSMFRARFFQNQDSVWQQRIVSDIESSFHFAEHYLQDASEILPLLATSQTSLDIEQGPILSVSLFHTESDGQILSLVAHHLVIDIVSWNIILPRLQDLLASRIETFEKPLSFQVWNAMQIAHATQREISDVDKVLPLSIKPADFGFWGIADTDNMYGDAKIASFSMDKSSTELAMGTSNSIFKTQPVELFLTALIQSFRQAFPQRGSPTIFNESHGRDTWDTSIEPTSTIGWFTSILPLHLADSVEGLSSIDILKRVKDLRRSIPANGREYFAHRYLTSDGRQRFADHMPMEVLLNYTGQSHQSNRNDAFFVPFSIAQSETEQRSTADVGPRAPRMALFEISIGATSEQINFSFMYNRNMLHQDGIREWMRGCHNTLNQLVTDLTKLKPQATLVDYPLLPTNYDGLTKHLTETFKEIGIKSLDEVEDMYPTAPTQDGLLLSQMRNPSQYINHVIFEVSLPEGQQKVDVPTLVRSWQKVVDRHQSLRTAFVFSVCEGHAFDQIALKQVSGGAKILHCTDDEFERELENVSLREVNKTRRPNLPHQFSICTTTSGKTYCKLALNHAVIDGGSVPLIVRDLALAYESRLSDGPKPLYSDYVKYISSIGQDAGTAFWKDYLRGVEACYLPELDPAPTKTLNSVYLDFDRFPELQSFCRKNEFTLSNVMLTAWGLVLRQYTNMYHVCFGNLTAGRDAPVDAISDTVGAFINMLVCRIDLSPNKSLIDVIRSTQSDFMDMLPHQHISLAKMQRDVGFTGQSLFNTAVSVQNQMSTRDAEREGSALEMVPVSSHDPTEYAVTVNIRSAPGDEAARIAYWTSLISDEEGQKLSMRYAEVLGDILDGVDRTVDQLDSLTVAKTASSSNLDLATMAVVQSKRTPTFREPQELQRSRTEDTVSTLDDGNTNPRTGALQPHVYRNLIKETVKETIEQLVRSGELIRPRIGGGGSEATFDGRDQYASPQGVDGFDFGTHKSYSEPGLSRQGSFAGTFSYEAMSTTLRELWSPLLDMPVGKIYDDDSFFALGGDSILAMELAKAARDVGLSLTVADIFDSPTFSDLVYALGRAEQKKQDILDASDTSSETEMDVVDEDAQQYFSLLESSNVDEFLQNYICPKVGLFRGGILDAFPVTDFQALAVTGTLVQSRWMLNYFTFDGEGPLDLGRLRRAAAQLVSSFAILRTVFVPCGNRFLQVVMRSLQPQVQIFDTDIDFEEYTTQLMEDGRHVSPRLGEPYTQFTVIRRKGTLAHRILLRLSHAQYDGVCMPYILEAFRSAYEGKDLRRAPPFSRYVKEAFASANSGSHNYWKGLLEGSTMTDVVSRQAPKYDSTNLKTKTLKQTVKLPTLTSRNITEATILKAAWSLTLAQLSGTSDITFGNVISGRNVPVDGVESIVGPCLNIIPVRIRLEPKWTGLELLRKVQQQQVAGMPYESLGFREIVQKCTEWHKWTYFGTVVQHQNLAREMEFELDRVSYKTGAVGRPDTLADLTMVSTPKGGDVMEVTLSFVDEGGVEEGFVKDALESVCSLAEHLVQTPMASIGDITGTASISKSLGMHQRHPIIKPVQTTKPGFDELLKDLTRKEINDIADTLARAWRLVLPSSQITHSSNTGASVAAGSNTVLANRQR
ncbi:MAG: hypothetical protein Q9174_000861, partial [Haloplaca sp. 1 TL-2023]